MEVLQRVGRAQRRDHLAVEVMKAARYWSSNNKALMMKNELRITLPRINL